MKAKRAACDRCHTMKMQCKTDSSGKNCRRCRNAGADCRYSEPGRPGRPTTKVNNVTKQNNEVVTAAAAASEDAAKQTGIRPTIPTPSPSSIDEQQQQQQRRRRRRRQQQEQEQEQQEQEQQEQQHTWIQNAMSQYSTTDGSIYLENEQNSDSPQDGLPSSFPSSPYQHQNEVDGDWLWDLSEFELCPQSLTLGNIRHDPSDISWLAGLAMDQSPTPVTLRLEERLPINEACLEHVAHFQLKIARRMNYLSHLGPAHLEQEAAHVLQCSAEFLELVSSLTSAESEWKGPRQSSPINTVVFLQLTSISIRLTEMHYWLYSSIYCRLQQEHPGRDHDATAGTTAPPTTATVKGDNSLTKLLAFSIAGVDLTPTCPLFRLQMLLHTGVHYLNGIQRSREGLKGFTLNRSSERSPGLALQMHMLVTEDQRSSMGNIHAVLNKLKQRFGLDPMMYRVQ